LFLVIEQKETNELCYVRNDQYIPYLFQDLESATKFYNWFLVEKEYPGFFGIKAVLKYPELKIINLKVSSFEVVE